MTLENCALETPIRKRHPKSFDGIPRFAPEHFARVVLKDPLKKKQLDAGLTQLSHEGVIQIFYHPHRGRSSLIWVL